MIDPKYITLSPDVKYIGVDDLKIDLFEGQYAVPEGMSYNSYLILDEKVCIMDTTDPKTEQEWLDNLTAALQGRKPDYLVVLHCEPDHAACATVVLERYPECKIVCSQKAAQFLPQFSEYDFTGRIQVVKEGEKLSLGKHELEFFMTPMVHWPEVMMAYESCDKILFTADAFGKFGALCHETDDWACEARRYYFNICGKYGASVQGALKKTAKFEIDIIAPLHGPVLRENLMYYGKLYDTWSKYEPETQGVFIAYASLHGNTAEAAELLKAELEARGVKVAITDLCRDDMAEAIEDAFRYDRIVLAAPTYDGGIMPPMEDFIHHLKSKAWQKRTVALIENGTWAPMAAKQMRAKLAEFKDITVLEPQVTILSSVKAATLDQIKALAEALD